MKSKSFSWGVLLFLTLQTAIGGFVIWLALWFVYWEFRMVWRFFEIGRFYQGNFSDEPTWTVIYSSLFMCWWLVALYQATWAVCRGQLEREIGVPNS